ncbi:DUF1178 family protein [Allosphingosinicella flava]|uniref:DUF1178 family protein n=1 Tax=Allosphingosinicella flava TaxID=2771430 RepID=A0A7T2GLG5_9SPHN|nr:DUF1178 family protein [Sphingosinicella flava]QPQ55952.1 DUF1178 family protein [Sphingosinicella flava]
MIVFDLRCGQDHVFEIWFGSSGDYADQKARGLVACPYCGDTDVDKAVMAPRVSAKGNRAAPDMRPVASQNPEAMKDMMAAMAALQKRMLAQSTYVGGRFADEARAIHHGEKDARPIHGKATAAETRSLIEEGVPVAPLPFPVLDPRDEN